MSPITESRVVQISFDNEDFERNVKQSLDTLTKLNNALEFKDGAKGLNNISKASQNLDLTGVSDSVSNASRHFSTLEVIGVTALANLANSAVNVGKRIVSSVVQPLTSGGLQRALNMEQAKFMLNGLLGDKARKAIGTVGELGTIMDNIYKSVDGTIYSLDKAALVAARLMASGIVGTGENAEITKILKAIAGVSSVFSTDYERVGDLFSTIKSTGVLMGQQVLSFTTMGVPLYAKLAEYLNKITKEGRDAGKSLKDMFPDNEKLVKALSDLGEGAKVTEADIKDMVSKGAISFDLFSDAMYDAFGEQASKSKEMYIGALEDMKAAAARIGEKFMKPLIGDSTAGTAGVLRDILNASVPLLDSLGNRLNAEGGAVETFANIVQNAGKRIVLVMDLIAAALDQDETEAQLQRLVDNGLADPSRLENLKTFAYQIQRIRDFFEGIGVIASSVFGILGAGFNVARSIFEFFAGIAESVLSVIAGAKAPLAALKANVKGWGEDLGGFISTLTGVIMNSQLVNGVLEIGKELFANFDKVVSKTGDSLVALATSASKVVQILGTGLAKTIKSIVNELKGVVSLTDIVNTGILASLTIKVGKVFELLKGEGLAFGAIFGDIQKRFGMGILNNLRKSSVLLADDLDALRTTLAAYQKNLKANILFKIAAAILALAISIKVLSTIDSDRLIQSVVALGVLGAILTVLMKRTLSIVKAMGKFSAKQLVTLQLVKGVFTSLALSLLAMAVAVKMLGSLNTEQVANGILGLVAIAGVMYLLFKSMAKVQKAEGAASIARIIVIAIAINMMAMAFAGLGHMDLDSIGRAALAMGIIAGILVIVQTLMSKISKVQNAASILPLIGIAIAFQMVGNTFRKLGMMEWKDIQRGIVAMGAAMSAVVVLLAVAGSASFKSILASSIAMAKIGGLLSTMAGVFQKLSELSYDQIERATVGLSLIVLALLGMTEVVSLLNGKGGVLGSVDISKSLVTGILLTAMANVIKTMAAAFIKLGSMEWEQIGKATVGFAGILAAVLIMVAISKAISKTGSGKDLLMFAGTLILLGLGFKAFAMGVNAMGSMDLKTLAVGILGVAAAILVLNGVAMLVSKVFMSFLKMTAGMIAFGVGLAAIGAGAFILGFGLASLAGSLKQITAEDVAAIITLVGAMAILSPIVKEIGISFLLFGAGVAAVGLGLIVVGVGIAALGLGFKVLASSAVGAIAALNEFANVDFSAVLKLSALVTIFGLLSPLIVAFGLGLLVAGAGLASLGGGIKVVVSALKAVKAVIDHLFDGVGEKLTGMVKSAVSSLKKLAPQAKTVAKTMKNIVKEIQSAVKKISNIYSESVRAGKHIVDGLVSGIRNNKSSAISAANALARETLAAYKAAMGISSPSREMAKLGRWTVLGLKRGIEENAHIATDSMGYFANAIMNAYEYVSDNTDLAPVITPVVDTSNVEQAVGSINSMMNMRSAVGLSSDMAGSTPTNRLLGELVQGLKNSSETSNSEMNNYITVDGSKDPSQFADELLRRFKLKARAI